MTILKSILRFLAGIGMFYWGYYNNHIYSGIANDIVSFFIGLCIWIVFYSMLQIAEDID